VHTRVLTGPPPRAQNLTYPAALKLVLAKDGVSGLLFRGLGTKILSNGMQGLMFNVLWRMGMDWWDATEKAKDDKAARR
jgi:hypothetical protein